MLSLPNTAAGNSHNTFDFILFLVSVINALAVETSNSWQCSCDKWELLLPIRLASHDVSKIPQHICKRFIQAKHCTLHQLNCRQFRFYGVPNLTRCGVFQPNHSYLTIIMHRKKTELAYFCSDEHSIACTVLEYFDLI